MSRAFYIAAAFLLCAVLLLVNSDDFRTKATDFLGSYFQGHGYGQPDIEIQNENSDAYCRKLSHSDLLRESASFSTMLSSAELLRGQIQQINCVESVSVRKIFPSTLSFNIAYKVPVAIWKNKKAFYFITAEGEVLSILSNANINTFLFVIGKNAPLHIRNLISFIAADEKIYAQIDSAVLVGERRWDINLVGGMKVLLPEEKPDIAWNKFVELQNAHAGFADKNHKVVDFRVLGKIYVR